MTQREAIAAAQQAHNDVVDVWDPNVSPEERKAKAMAAADATYRDYLARCRCPYTHPESTTRCMICGGTTR